MNKWPAPAKLNLFLYINGYRADGYHSLQTLFQFLDYGDILEIIPNQSGKIELINASSCLCNPEENIILRAAKVLRENAKMKGTLSFYTGAEIKLEKKIPIGGGLGGGSSDAATTLIVLNNLWCTMLNKHQLIEIGRKLGEDVPIFIHGHAAFLNHEKIHSIKLIEKWYLVIYPQNISIETKRIFYEDELKRNSSIRTLDHLLSLPFKNDCEDLVRKKFSKINELISWLRQYNSSARLTGTGSCIFSEFNTKNEAYKVFKKIPEWACGFVSKSSNISPLYQVLNT